MRKQYHFRPSNNGYYAWDVDKLVQKSKNLEVIEVGIDSIPEFNQNYWYNENPPTCKSIAEHFKLANETNLEYPVILSAEHTLMDGMHRIIKAYSLGRTSVKAVKFEITPSPDYTDVFPDDLPYEIEEGLGSDNSAIIGTLIDDVVNNSRDKNELRFSDRIFELTTQMKEFNYDSIYKNSKLSGQDERIHLILDQLYKNFLNLLKEEGDNLLTESVQERYPYRIFSDFLRGMKYDKYTDNEIIVSDFIAGMSDSFAMRSFEDLFYLKPII